MIKAIKILLIVELLILFGIAYYYFTYDENNLYGPAFGLLWPVILAVAIGLSIIVLATILFVKRHTSR